MLTDLDLILRGGAIAILGLLSVLMWRTPIARDGRMSVLAVALAKSAFLVLNTQVVDALAPPLILVLAGLASAMPMAVTWLLLAIFLDPPMPRWPWIAAAGVVSGALLVTTLTGGSVVICGLMSMALFAGLFALALWPAPDDLVDCRCRARPGFAAAIAGYGLFSTGVQVLGGVDAATPWFALVQSGGTLTLALAFGGWILRPDASHWPGAVDSTASSRPVPPDPVAPEDAALIARIRAAMADGIWREEGLTIGALAARLAVPEHRLRRAINRGLGHRNFSSFINSARVKAAQEALADPAQMGRTVLEIAYETGFASLGPFNRAFRAETGQSPTEYRRAALETGTTMRADLRKLTPMPANLH